jgi:hypothetical protein
MLSWAPEEAERISELREVLSELRRQLTIEDDPRVLARYYALIGDAELCLGEKGITVFEANRAHRLAGSVASEKISG